METNSYESQKSPHDCAGSFESFRWVAIKDRIFIILYKHFAFYTSPFYILQNNDISHNIFVDRERYKNISNLKGKLCRLYKVSFYK